ncbi:hypothetical protein IEQ34_017227 [Dendrobium chrysotoxum]|uniref:Peptidase A1 domain-containing protein n=1 Tax=Dendrobium chrysotoxum TaxID=161865 RepID=A0AAV7GAK1_DENCH|nr:hypothetical protein IEQ34_017227 [Dendrobium chrysotoxum]
MERMQKQKGQVMQPVTMAVLIAVVILSELPSFSALINSSSLSAIPEKPVSRLAADTMDKTYKLLPSNFVKIPERYPWYESQSIRYIRCDEPLCIDVHESTTHKCKNTELCYYEISYHDEATSKGLLVTDTFALHLKGGSPISPTLAIGSSTYYSSKGRLNSQSTTHGMLGLGKGKISILSQLHKQGNFANIFGHCLSSNPGVSGGVSGFMFIGKDFDYPRCLTWVPMSSDVSHYSLTTAEVIYGDHEQSLLGRNQAFVLDSGTTDTYFLDPMYQELLTKVTKTTLQKAPGDGKHPICWKDTRPFTSILDLKNRFSSIYLRLQNGKALEIPAENYLIITEAGYACLGIFNSGDIELSFNLIGAISMQNVTIVYDNERQQIGWARVAGCSQPPVGICTS